MCVIELSISSIVSSSKNQIRFNPVILLIRITFDFPVFIFNITVTTDIRVHIQICGTYILALKLVIHVSIIKENPIAQNLRQMK